MKLLVSFIHELAGIGLGFLRTPAAGMNVNGRRFPGFAAQELVDGHAGAFALDVPQSLIDTRDGIVENRAVASVAVDRGHLPDSFDAVHIGADREWFEMPFNRRLHGMNSLLNS